MLSIAKRLQALTPHLRYATTVSRASKRRWKPPSFIANKTDEKSEWWIVDGEMHEIGEQVPPRERFVIPRDNIPNRKRKQLRDQFMRRTRLVLKESEHEPWCRRYMELYEELRENWERLYWDEGFSKKIAQDHAKYDSAEDDDHDSNPYRNRRSEQMKDQDSGRNRQVDHWEKVNQLRDKFEYDREKRMREKAFAPMNRGNDDFHDSNSRNRPFDRGNYSSSVSNPRNQPFDRGNYDLPDSNTRNQPFGRGNYNFADSNSRNRPVDAQRYFSGESD